MIQTKIMSGYMVKLALRITIFLTVFLMYLYDKSLLVTLLNQPLFSSINFLHILWLIFMFMMLKHLFPKEPFTMALLKSKKKKYVPVDNHSRLELLEFIQKQNIAAWRVMLIWLLGNSVIGLLHALNILNDADLFMLTVFYFLCDYICILFYCPFQTHIMKNKCCVNCRIYDWGHFMMFTPMVFIHNFYTISLFLMACVVLVHWELVYAKHPERFYSGSNQRLQCQNCTDKICQIKNKIRKQG